MRTKSQLFVGSLIGLAVGIPLALRADTLPKIIDPPLTQFAWLGRPVTFTISYTNKTPMRFQWQWNGANLSDATNKTFRLNSAQLTNGGDYRVILSNSAGVVTSVVARLTVRDWPQPTGVSFTNLSRLETSLQTIMRTHAVRAASLAVMKDGRLILARGYGYADSESDEQVQPDSLFRIASLSKAITATAVLKLVDEGRLNLDDKVFPMLNLPPPTFSGAQMDSRRTNITVRHLLNHTAGWDRNTARNPLGGIGFEPYYWTSRAATDLGVTNRLTARDALIWITGFPLQTAPGATYAYSNNGYLVAGVFLEKIAGKPYEEVIRSLLAPVDITRLHFFARTRADRRPEEVEPALSPLYNFRIAEANYVEFPSAISDEITYSYPPDPFGGGAAWATSPMDYARFITTIDGKPAQPDLLSSNAVKTMLTVTAQSVSYGQPYGMGWMIDPSTGEISHAGALVTGSRSLAVRRSDGVVYVVFCSTYDDTLNDDLKGILDSAVSAIKTWPTNDLFPATMSYEAWQAWHFTPDELMQPSISDDDADPDGDGISNLLEYAQASDPRVADYEPWLGGRLVGEGNQLQFALEYRRRPLGHAVAYDVEVSSDLKMWLSWNPVTITENLDPDGFVSVSLLDDSNTTSAGPRFYRVKVRPSHPKQ